MGFRDGLKRLGLVEDVETEIKDLPPLETIEPLEVELELDLGLDIPVGLKTDNLVAIETIYENFQLLDKSKSIFKVNEFLKTLPDSLPTDVKRQTVIGILGASGLVLDKLIEDAANRLQVLGTTLNATKQETNDRVAASKSEIFQLEQKIDELKQEINDRLKMQENQDKVIIDEVKDIEAILDFINGKK